MRRLAALPIALTCSLLVTAVLAGGAQAAPARLSLHVSRPAAGRLAARLVATDVRGIPGAWQVVLRGTDAAASRAIRVVISTGDEQFYGRVEVVAGSGASARVIARRSLDAWLGGGAQPARVCDPVLRACLSPSDIVLPADDNGTLGVTFSGLGRRAYSVAGAARFATDPFIFGPWVRTGTVRL
jgi:hypothetical protein